MIVRMLYAMPRTTRPSSKASYRRFLCRVLILTVTIVPTGCALPLGTRTVDATNDPEFRGGYRQGQVYRLKSDGYLMEWRLGNSGPVKVLCAVVGRCPRGRRRGCDGEIMDALTRIPAGSRFGSTDCNTPMTIISRPFRRVVAVFSILTER